MNEIELRLFSNDEVKIIAYEWDGLQLVLVETTYDKTRVSSQLSDNPPDDGWWADTHDYDNTYAYNENGDVICATCGSMLSDATQIAKAWVPLDDEEEI